MSFQTSSKSLPAHIGLNIDKYLFLGESNNISEYIKNKGIHSNVAVISASVLDKDREYCKNLNIKYFLLKPFSMTNLKIVMNKLINGTI